MDGHLACDASTYGISSASRHGGLSHARGEGDSRKIGIKHGVMTTLNDVTNTQVVPSLRISGESRIVDS